MDIFKENEAINKFDELEQALLLFSVQTKHIDEISENDCKLIASLLEELKARRVIHTQAEKEYFNGFNRALDEVDEIITEQLDKSDNQVECQTLRWVLGVLSDLIQQNF